MPIQETYNDGTITVTAGSAVVTGVGTAWLVRLVNGGELSFKGGCIPIASVEGNTSLTLDYAAPESMAGTGVYSIAMGKADAASTLVATRLLADLTSLLNSGISPFATVLLTKTDAPSLLTSLGFSEFTIGMTNDADATMALESLGLSAFFRGLVDETTGGGVLTGLGVSDFAKTLLDDVDGQAALTTLGVSSFGKTLVTAGTSSAALTAIGVSAFAQTLLDDADASAALSSLGFTAFAKTLLDDADAAAARATLQLGNVNNTADADKPVSVAQQTADNLRLLKSQNLGDLPDKAAARANLGVPSTDGRKLLQVVDITTPVTEIIASIPAGVRAIRITGTCKPNSTAAGSNITFSFNGGATYPSTSGTYTYSTAIIAGGTTPGGSTTQNASGSIPLSAIQDGNYVLPFVDVSVDFNAGLSTTFRSDHTYFTGTLINIVMTRGGGPVGVATHMKIRANDNGTLLPGTHLLIEGF